MTSKPTTPRDSHGEQVFDYPISHYVGYTSGLPLRRLWTHGAKSSRHVVAVIPGDERREHLAKELEACPACGRSLWYYGESPRPIPLLQAGDVVSRGARGRLRYRVSTDAAGRVQLHRIDRRAPQVLSAAAARRFWPSLVVRERDPESYRARQHSLQAGLRGNPRPTGADLERLREAAYRAIPSGGDDASRIS